VPGVFRTHICSHLPLKCYSENITSFRRQIQNVNQKNAYHLAIVAPVGKLCCNMKNGVERVWQGFLVRYEVAQGILAIHPQEFTGELLASLRTVVVNFASTLRSVEGLLFLPLRSLL
jgi:hypothetical protein